MDIKQEDVRRYVPEWDNNRDRDESEQIILHLVPMTGGELRAAQRELVLKNKKLNDDEVYSFAEQAVERIIKTRVVKVENCFDIKGHPIVDGGGLWDQAESDLTDEAYQAMTKISTLRSGLKKD